MTAGERPEYRYVLADQVTGVVYDELPFRDVEFSVVLNDIGEMGGTVPRRIPTYSGPKYAWDSLDPETTKLCVVRDEVALWVGHLKKRKIEGKSVVVEVASVESYFASLFLTASKKYDDDDTATIFRDVVATVLQYPHADISIVLDDTLSGITADRTYHGYELPRVLDLMNEWTEDPKGFDWKLIPVFDGVRVTERLVLGSPRLGSADGPTFEYGTNVASYTLEENAVALAKRSVASGFGEGEATLRSDVSVTEAEWGTGPLRMAKYQDADVKRQTTLDSRNSNVLRSRQKAPKVVEVTLDSHALPKPGQFGIGDTCRLVVDDEEIQIDRSDRIMAWGVSVTGDNNDEQPWVQFMPEEALGE